MKTTPIATIHEFTKHGYWGHDTLHSLLETAVNRARNNLALLDPPNRSALVGGEAQRLTYAEVDASADLMARRFYELGLRQGDVILLQMPNVVEIVLVYLAAARLGLIVSPLAMQYGQHEIEHFAKTVRPKAYLAFTTFQDKPFLSEQAPALPDGCQTIAFPIEAVPPVGDGDQLTRVAYEEYRSQLTLDANDIFTICWTSGTTGRSKGVPRSHNHWLSSTLASEDAIGLQEHAVILNPFPFVNMAAIGGFLFYWLKVQATMALHHPFDPTVFLTQLQTEKVEYTIAPPALLTRLLQTKEQIKAAFDLSSVRVIGSGSAPLHPTMISGFKEEFGIDVVNIFGSNEGMALLSGPEDVPDTHARASFFPRFGRADIHWRNRISKQLETKLVDIDSGHEITAAGQSGELLIMGSTVFDGYYESPADNASAFTNDGFFRTGDLFEIAGDNLQYYRFVGRCKSLIVRGGINISPEELDEVIETHPNVLEAAVASYPDDVLGERICAYVVPKEGCSLDLQDLIAFLEAKKVAKFKWPEKIKILASLPRNAMNKVMRASLS